MWNRFLFNFFHSLGGVTVSGVLWKKGKRRLQHKGIEPETSSGWLRHSIGWTKFVNVSLLSFGGSTSSIQIAWQNETSIFLEDGLATGDVFLTVETECMIMLLLKWYVLLYDWLLRCCSCYWPSHKWSHIHSTWTTSVRTQWQFFNVLAFSWP